MTSDFSTKITKVKTALEAVFIKKTDIKDDLTSTDTDKPLSANQGKQLNDTITTHDSSVSSHQDIRTSLNQKEVTSNKSSSITTDTGSTSKYPTVKAVEDYAVQKIPMGDVYGTSTSLQRQIQDASSGNTIVLDKDYLNNSSASSISLSNKNITIIGNGHIIDGNNKMITFSALGTTTLKISNCVFQNLNFNSGMTLFQATDSAKIILDNCIFKNINIKTNSGIINTNQALGNYTYTNAEIKILNSSFLSITGNTFLNFYDTNFSIINTIFENNAPNSILVNNTSSTNFTQEVINCIFNNNHQSITDSSTGIKSLVLKNNHFLQSGDTITGCTNNNYLTSHQDISGKANISDLGNLAYEDDIDLSTHDVSELTDTNNTAFTPKSHTHGNINNDGTFNGVHVVDTYNMNVVTDNHGVISLEDKYTHPNDLGSTKTSGLYKIALNNKGHVTSATSVEKSDITGLGIPASDTTYSLADGTTNGLSSNDFTSAEKTKLSGIATGANNYTHPASHGNITSDGKCSTTGTVDVSRGDLLLFADATSGANQYTIKGSTFVDALNDLILDLIDEGES